MKTTARRSSPFLLALLAAAPAAVAESPCHTFALPGVFDTVYNGNASASMFVPYLGGVSDCLGSAKCVELACSLQSLFAATWASEAAVDIEFPNGVTVTTRLSRLSQTYSTLTNSISRVAVPSNTTAVTMAGTWHFRFYDTFNDSGGLAESRVANVSVRVYSKAVPSVMRTVTISDGVDTARTEPANDTGAFGQVFVKINTPPVTAAAGEYLRIDASASQGIPSPNRGNQPGYAGPWTVAIYNANGEVLSNGTTSLTVNFGASGPDRKDGAAGSMGSGPNTTGPLYVSFMPWDVTTETFYDDPDYPAYSQYLPRAYPSFGMRGEAQFASYYDFSVRVQRGTEATSPDWPDLSTVYTGRPLSSTMTPSSTTEARLLRFRLPGPIHRSNGDWLDIDTSYSNLSATYGSVNRNDCEIALFDASGHLIASDDDDGAGFASSLSFGAQAPVRPHIFNADPGLDFNGRDGADLAAGEYYLALSTFNVSFADGFTVSRLSSPSAVTGSISLNISASVTPVTACGPADIGGTGGTPGADGVLDNNDFVVFIQYFFDQNPLADQGSTGGNPGADNAWDNNDFVVFISNFFAGCP